MHSRGPTASVPTTSVPIESVPIESAPIESAPIESAPIEIAPINSAPIESAPIVGEGVVAGANVVIRAPTPVQGHVWVTRGGGRAVSAPPGRASGSMGPLPDPSESLSGHVRSTA